MHSARRPRKGTQPDRGSTGTVPHGGPPSIAEFCLLRLQVIRAPDSTSKRSTDPSLTCSSILSPLVGAPCGSTRTITSGAAVMAFVAFAASWQ